MVSVVVAGRAQLSALVLESNCFVQSSAKYQVQDINQYGPQCNVCFYHTHLDTHLRCPAISKNIYLVYIVNTSYLW